MEAYSIILTNIESLNINKMQEMIITWELLAIGSMHSFLRIFSSIFCEWQMEKHNLLTNWYSI
jgi:hypothetical protein